MILQEDFRRLVEQQLVEQQLSRSGLARRMEVTPSYVGDYLNGRNSPGADVMERFFRALGIRVRLTVESVASQSAPPVRKPRRRAVAPAA